MGYLSFKKPPHFTDDLSASIFSSERSGYMMFNDFAQRIGADIRTLGRPYDDENSHLEDAAQLWVIAPEGQATQAINGDVSYGIFDEDEITRLEDYVAGGGSLIIAPHYDNYMMVEPLIDKAGFGLDIVDIAIEENGEDGKIRFVLKPEPDTDFLSNVNEVVSFVNFPRDGESRIFRLSNRGDGGKIILSDEYGAAVAWVPLGNGEVILISDPYIFSNFLLAESDNNQFAANILARAEGDPIYIDEYHHGFLHRRSFVDILSTRSGRGLAFLIGVVLIAVLSAGRRFGRILPPHPPERRSPAEYVLAMGLLFKRAKARDLALDVIERDFANFLQRRFRLRTLDPIEVEAQLKLMGYEEHKEITAILREFEKLRGQARPSSKRLLRLTRRIDPLKGAQV